VKFQDFFLCGENTLFHSFFLSEHWKWRRNDIGAH